MNPCDYASHNPPPIRKYSDKEKEELGNEEPEEDMEILVCRQTELADAVTLPVLQRYTEEDTVLRHRMEDISQGVISRDMEKAGYGQCF